VNEDVPWRWVLACVCGHAEFVLRREDTEMVESNSSLFWHQSHHRPAIESCREVVVVARGERAALVEGVSANLKKQAGREGTVVWVETMC
jgi:regulator of RNase E activity RraA